MVDRVERAVGMDPGAVASSQRSSAASTASPTGAVRALRDASPELVGAPDRRRTRDMRDTLSRLAVQPRLRDAPRSRELVPAASVGIRSLSEEEAEHLRAHPAPIWSTRQFRALGGRWEPILESLTPNVFVTFDLDGLDPAFLPATGTPEPGGLDWYEAVDLLRAVSEQEPHRRLRRARAGAAAGHVASDFLAARLVVSADRPAPLARRWDRRDVGASLALVRAYAGRTTSMAGTVARLVLRKNQDRRVRGGHPWIFSNEVGRDSQASPTDGDLVEVNDVARRVPRPRLPATARA